MEQEVIYHNVAVDDDGYFVGWHSGYTQYHFAVHVLLQPDMSKPSRCSFFNTANEAFDAKAYMESKYYKDIQRVEVCKVEHR